MPDAHSVHTDQIHHLCPVPHHEEDAKILVMVAFIRELLGSGTLLGFNILNYDAIKSAGYVNNGLMLMPPMALIIVACIIWYQRAKHKELQEKE